MNHHRPSSAFAIALAAALALTACQGSSAPPAESAAPASPPPAFEPKITVDETPASFTTTDAKGRTITLHSPAPVTTVTGTDPLIAEKFSTAVAETHRSQLQEQLDEYRRLDVRRCIGEPYGDVPPGTSCELDTGDLVVESTDVHGDYGTVVLRSTFLMNDAGGERNPRVHAVTMNLRTGERADLTAFLDLEDPAASQRAASALTAADGWNACTTLPTPQNPADYLGEVAGFAPTATGLKLYWATNGYAAECQVREALVPWPSGQDATPSAAESPAPSATNGPATAEGIDGKWCPTPESASAEDGCVRIELPNATFDSGRTVQLSGGAEQAGGFSFQSPGAPFGVYYPAGVAIDVPSYYPGDDLPEQDRIWNSQTGTMYTRG